LYASCCSGESGTNIRRSVFGGKSSCTDALVRRSISCDSSACAASTSAGRIVARAPDETRPALSLTTSKADEKVFCAAELLNTSG